MFMTISSNKDWKKDFNFKMHLETKNLGFVVQCTDNQMVKDDVIKFIVKRGKTKEQR